MEATTALAKIIGDEPLAEPETLQSTAGSIVFHSAASPDHPEENQDHGAVVMLPDGGCVLAVADGVGGLPGGATASRRALQSLVEAVSGTTRDGLRAAILDGFETANQAVRDLGIGAGTTLAVVGIAGDTMRPFHVGDSMVLVVGQRGRIKQQTIAHSPLAHAVDAGLMDETDDMVREHSHVLSNMVGAEDMRIEIGSHVNLAERDTVLLATDGLSDNLEADEIVETIRKGPMVRAARHLAQTSHARMVRPESGKPSKPDDCTFILRRLR